MIYCCLVVYSPGIAHALIEEIIMQILLRLGFKKSLAPFAVYLISFCNQYIILGIGNPDFRFDHLLASPLLADLNFKFFLNGPQVRL